MDDKSDGAFSSDADLRTAATAEPGVGFTDAELRQCAKMKPYLQEMDDLLRSCEELTGVPLGRSCFDEQELSWGDPDQIQEEASSATEAYFSTSYMDTRMEAGDDRERAAGELPLPCLTSTGNKLSRTLVEYEGQLKGMLAMLESCMEEAGMDFEPQDWEGGVAQQDYVHISKDPRFRGGTTLGVHTEEAPNHRVQIKSDDEASGVLSNPEQARPGCAEERGLSAEETEGQDDFKHEVETHDPRFMFSGLLLLTHDTRNDPKAHDGTKTGHLLEISTIETHTKEPGPMFEERHKAEGCTDVDTVKSLDCRMERCIEEVGRLERKRRKLLVEVLTLRRRHEPETEDSGSNQTKQDWTDGEIADLLEVSRKKEEERREERKKGAHGLKEQKAEEERKIWRVNLERQGLQDELRKLKRRVFAMVREGICSQAALSNQRREVELLRREEEQLSSLLLQVKEEGDRLRATQQGELAEERAKLQELKSKSRNAQREPGGSERHSCEDIQKYLHGEHKALEERFEPVLLALLKRKEAAEAALAQAREQSRELKIQLAPLREEARKLHLQRVCLEERLKLTRLQRQEDSDRYKETLSQLEERSRKLKMELEIQKRMGKEMEEARDVLTKQLLLHRAAIEDQRRHNPDDKT